MIKPLRSGLWFVLDKDYNAYDTLAVVDNLQKKFEEGDILPESEIINNQAPAGPLGLDVSTIPSRKGKQRSSLRESGSAQGARGYCPAPRALTAYKKPLPEKVRAFGYLSKSRQYLHSSCIPHRAMPPCSGLSGQFV